MSSPTNRIVQMLSERPVVSLENGCLVGLPGGGFAPPGMTALPTQAGFVPLSVKEETLPAMPMQAAAPAVASSHGDSIREVYKPPVILNAVPLVDGVEMLEPNLVKQLLDSGECRLVDVRGDDRQSGLIPILHLRLSSSCGNRGADSHWIRRLSCSYA